MMNKSPSPWSNNNSGETRESEQHTITANGCCPVVSSCFRCDDSSGWVGWFSANLSLPAFNLSSGSKLLVSCCAGVLQESKSNKPAKQNNIFISLLLSWFESFKRLSIKLIGSMLMC